MNRSLTIILVPALLVAAGYIVVLRMMGVAPGYLRLTVAVGAFLGLLCVLARRAKKANSGG